MLDGVARKLALPFVLFSAVGWVTFAVGFGLTNFGLKDRIGEPATDILYFPQWGFGVSSLLLFAVTITHLFCGNPVTIFLIMFFQAFYYACGGAILYRNSELIRGFWDAGNQQLLYDDYYSIIVELTGAGVSMLFYWISLLFWPCFRKKTDDYEDA